MYSFNRKSWWHAVGVVFLASQLLAIAYARFVPERFFCWSPYDEHTRYKIDVEVDGNPLSEEEITERYRYSANGWEVRAIDNVISLVRQYEMTYGQSDNAKVTIKYEINGHPQQTWTWTES